MSSRYSNPRPTWVTPWPSRLTATEDILPLAPAPERKWVIAVYLITVFIALPALVIILVGVLQGVPYPMYRGRPPP